MRLPKPKKIIGKNTVSAMSSGVYWGYVGLINCLLTKIEEILLRIICYTHDVNN